MRIMQPADVRQMRGAVINGVGFALGFLLLYLAVERFNPGIAKRLGGGGAL
jgi:hypothetical protein